VLTAAERDRLERRAAAEERRSSNQVAVAIFPSLEGESLEDFSIRLAQQWRIGQKGLDNGVILLVFVNDRKLRIEVGYGLEGRLTDAQASSIIRNEITPRFREQRYAAGIEAGLDAIYRTIAGEYKAPARAARKTDPTVTVLLAFLGVIAFIVLANTFTRAARRPGRMLRRGYTAGSGGWYAGGPGWGGGFGGYSSGGGGSSSGGGGFSGGGGSFGGGGSSGSW
jgi:uncharacterized protein